MKIQVIGHSGRQEVVENLGFNHDRGCYAKAVLINGVDRIVISERASGPWRLATPLVDLSGIALAAKDRSNV
jgi:hypothetical protein